MKRVRIVRRVAPNSEITFVIQQKHFLFRWLWVDAWINSIFDTSCDGEFCTLKEAEDNLWRFDGSESKETVVAEYPK